MKRLIWLLFKLLLVFVGTTLVAGYFAPFFTGLPFMPDAVSDVLWGIHLGINQGKFGQELPGNIISGTETVGNTASALGSTIWALAQNRGIWVAVGIFILWRVVWPRVRTFDPSDVGHHMNSRNGLVVLLLVVGYIIYRYIRNSGGIESLPQVFLPVLVLGVLLLLTFSQWGRAKSWATDTFSGLFTAAVAIGAIFFGVVAALSSTGTRFNLLANSRLAPLENFAYTVGSMVPPMAWGIIALVAIVWFVVQRQKTGGGR